MRILDLSAGHRHIWFNKKNPAATFVDCRAEVEPDVIADTRRLPAEIGDGYSLIVFDPPHCNFGKTSKMVKLYGHHTSAEIRSIVSETAVEAHRVAAPNALMAFKWNTHDQKLEKILALMPQWEPLFGHIVSAPQRRPSTTYWVMLRRLP